MRTFGKWLGRLLLAFTLAAVVVGLWKREEITRLLAVNSLFSEEKIIQNFSDMEAAFLSTPVSRGTGPTVELGYGPETTLPAPVDQWIADRSVTSRDWSRRPPHQLVCRQKLPFGAGWHSPRRRQHHLTGGPCHEICSRAQRRCIRWCDTEKRPANDQRRYI
jgi:hypothetical protein